MNKQVRLTANSQMSIKKIDAVFLVRPYREAFREQTTSNMEVGLKSLFAQPVFSDWKARLECLRLLNSSVVITGFAKLIPEVFHKI